MNSIYTYIYNDESTKSRTGFDTLLKIIAFKIIYFIKYQ